MATNDLTAQRLREVLEYNPGTGEFRQRHSHRNWPAGRIVGTRDNHDYVKIRVDGRYHKAHRLAWLYHYGVWPGLNIDHINRVKGDNRIENLRDVSTQFNNHNVADARGDNIAGYLGVSKKGDGRFKAVIKATLAGHRLQLYLGSYKTPEIAHAVYMDAKRRLHDGAVPQGEDLALTAS